MKKYALLPAIFLLQTSTVLCQVKPEKAESFKLAVCQMKVVGGDRTANLAHAGEMIAEAVAQEADLVLLPEAMDLGWTHPSALTAAEPVPEGKTFSFLADMARENRVYICSGLIEKEGDKVYNSAVIIDRQGELLLLHRKINELDIGHPYYELGERLNVCETEFGTLGLLICADANSDGHVLTRSLAYMGADVILSPSSWAVVADHNNQEKPYGGTWLNAYKPVANDFRVWIAGCSNVGWMTGGPWKGWKGIGCSMVIGPGGKEFLRAPYGVDADTTLYVEIAPESRPAQGTTWNNYWNSPK
ncbi:MAG: carbon-nitrogen hydrolase family protein [Bacteroidetes bacterium]|nr:carbon-nitrogen hydrolase family protein [Bacteroidota bacterium]